jgi:molecular chaperone DnaK
MTKIIPRNTTIPTKKSQVFTTAADNQTSVTIHVLQGEREMAKDNKSIGRFDLVGIPPAPRGIPQIEVTFDIDANGILHVTAKDMGTGKEQSIRITPSSGLTEEEIDKMVKDAEAHADEDKKRKELIEVRNQADNIVYATEKSLKEHGDKVDPSTKDSIEKALENLKKVQNDEDVDKIKAAIEELTKVSHKLAEEMYKTASANAGNPEDSQGQGAESNQSETNTTQSSGDDVVDADFEEVKDNKK